MRLLVLAGGFGTRLKTIDLNVPKALAPIGSEPLMRFQIEHWFAQGVREFTFLLHHQANQIIDFLQVLQSGRLTECKFNWLIEPEPMGTGGAIAHAVKELKLSDDFLVTNADTWLGAGVYEMRKTRFPSLAAIRTPHVGRYGEVLFDHTRKITAFTEKNAKCEDGWINAGLYHLSPKQFTGWNGMPFSLEHELFRKLVEDRELSVVLLETDFIDIGIPADYYRFCRWMKGNRRMPL